MSAIPSGNLIDGSLSSATGSSEEVFAQNTGRQYLLLQNISATDFWVDFGTAAVADEPSIKIAAGDALEFSAGGTGVVPTAAVNVIGTAAAKLVAKQA